MDANVSNGENFCKKIFLPDLTETLASVQFEIYDPNSGKLVREIIPINIVNGFSSCIVKTVVSDEISGKPSNIALKYSLKH